MRFLILGAIAIAGCIVAVDSIRQRRALRRIVPVRAVVAAALARAPAAATGPVVIPDPTASGGVDLWETLEDRVDPEAFVPLLAAGTEVKKSPLTTCALSATPASARTLAAWCATDGRS